MRAVAVVLAAVLIACGAPAGRRASDGGASTAWRHLATTVGMLERQAAAAAVETQQDLDRAWVKHKLPGRTPAVDFQRNFVLLLGQADDDCVDELIRLQVRRCRLHVEWLPPPGGCAEPLVFRIHAVEVDRRHVPRRFEVAFPKPYSRDAKSVKIEVAAREGQAPDEPLPPKAMSDEHLAAVFRDHPVKRCEGEPAWMADGGGAGSQRAALPLLDEVQRWLRRHGYRENVDFVPFLSRRDGVRPGVLVDNGRAGIVKRRLDEVYGHDVVDVHANPYDFREIDRAQRGVNDLMASEGPGSIVATNGIPGPVEIGMIDPTREALDRVAHTVDPALVCVGPILSGVKTAGWGP